MQKRWTALAMAALMLLTASCARHSPSERSSDSSQAKVWRPVLTGEGVSEIEIYFDGELYQVYDMDFDANPPEFTLRRDYSDEFTQ